MDARPRPGAIGPRAILMIHGAFCGGWAFDTLAAFFEARGYRCLAPSLRHHDRAPHLPPHPDLATTSMADYVSDLLEIVDRQETPPIVMGHSLGGLLAQMVAARRPVAAAVLLAPSAPWGVLPDGPMELLGAGSLYLSGAFWQEALAPVADVAKAYTLNHLSREDRRRITKCLVHESGRATFEALHWAQDPNRTTFVFPRDVKCPVLGLAGSHDHVNPPGLVRRITRRYRNGSEFMLLDGMSHWLLSEPGWEDMAERIAAWLERVLATPAKA